ncbi:hypothetical protein AB0M20_18790 [Actinoplanes sp. NPDC051633]|uniref:hypothetical protein n=1 Tax=Actinoplanes sp. NPDC051633 TaxID=3155670 RepID=UPI003442FBFE
MDYEVDRPYDQGVAWRLLRLALGLVPIGFGFAVLAAPEPALNIAGALFGINLVVTGLVRAALSLIITMYPKSYRVTAVILGVLTAAVGIACLHHLPVAALLLALVVGVGWLFGSPAYLFGGADDPLAGWRFRIGIAAIPAAGAVLIWRVASVANFITFAAVFFVSIGIVETVAAAAAFRPDASGADR